MFFSVLSAELNPINILLNVKASFYADFKIILPSFGETLNITFLFPFLLAYQSLILSLTFVVAANFSVKSIYLEFIHSD